MQYVAIACRCLLGFVFLWSLVVKARSGKAYEQFLAPVRELAGATPGAARLLAAAAVAAELLIVVLLAVPGLITAGYTMALALLVAYSGTLALALRRGVRVPCRCLATRTQADLYESIVGLPSLTALEDPAYLNRVRLAQQAAISGPQQVFTGLLSLVQAVVTLTGFIAALASLDGWIAVLIVASAIPELAAELRLGRRRADLLVSTVMAQRRVSAFGFLLVDPRAAGEIQTFRVGRVLHARMLELLRQVSGGTHARNLAEVRTRGVLALLAALRSMSLIARTLSPVRLARSSCVSPEVSRLRRSRFPKRCELPFTRFLGNHHKNG